MELPRELRERFELLGSLGRGGMGEVLRVLDRTSGREVALKLLLAGGSPERLARFQREGCVTAALEHEGIVRVHGAGQAGGRAYLIYELVEGARTLDQAFTGLPRTRRVAMVRDAALAVGHAHARGIVHRDLKPQNVLVDRAGRVRVTDFGLATGTTLETLTRTGHSVGTPLWMSPEQLFEAGEPTARMDVWALGAMLYLALTGRHPFESDNVVQLSSAIAAGRFPRPRRLDPTIPRELELVCLQALTPDPAARQPDGEAFAADLAAPAAPRPPVGRALLLLALAAAAGLLWVGLRPGAAVPDAHPPASPAPIPSAQPAPPASLAPPGLIPPLEPGDELDPELMLLREEAQIGGAVGLYVLGKRRVRMHGKDDPAARRLIREAAAAGCHQAMVWLGDALLDEKDPRRDPAEARSWFERAASQGYPAAWLRLGRLTLEEGDGAAAEQAFRRGADAGEPRCLTDLARALEEGAAGLPRDPLRAHQLYLQAAERRQSTAARRAGRTLSREGGPVPCDPERARALLLQAIEGGEHEAALDLGRMLLAGRPGLEPDPLEAIRWLRHAAEREGDEWDARHELACLLLDGAPGVPRDPPAALALLQQVEGHGARRPLRRLAELLWSGDEGVTPEPGRAMALLERTAEGAARKDPGLLVQVARWHLDGTRRPRDPAAARRWLEQAAEVGHTTAMVELARLLGELGETEAAERWAARAERRKKKANTESESE